MKRLSHAIRLNIKFATTTWGELSPVARRSLKELTERYALSVVGGDLLHLEGRWYVTHAGLLRLAERNRCSGIRVQPVREFCNPAANR